MTELDEIKGTVGPMSLIRLNEQQIVFQIHPERPDGCSAVLDKEECEELIGVLSNVADCPVTFKGKAKAPIVTDLFHDQLIERIQKVACLEYAADKRSGIQKWLSENLFISKVSAGRYITGDHFPMPRIARAMAELLGWDYDDLVTSIIETSDMRHHAIQLRRYHVLKGRI
jgi:hypothetical protein